METIKLAIITKDPEYGKTLSLALVNAYKNFTVTLLKSGQLHTVVITEYDLVITDIVTEDDQFIRLAERPSMVVKDCGNNVFSLYKYGNVRELAGELIYIYSFRTGRGAVPVKNEDVRLVVFGAMEGGIGCTSAAMAFCQEIKRFHGKKVLYISLEEIESTLEYMEPFPGGKNIGEYLYYLFDKKEKGEIPFIESFLVFDYYGIDAFIPSMGRNLLNTLTSEEMQYFISTLSNCERYDYLVVDAGCSLGKGALCCYEMANNICFLERVNAESYKTSRFIEYLLFMKGETILESVRKVKVGEPPTEDQEQEELMEIISYLPIDREAFSREEGIRSIALDSNYGKVIKNLADSLLQIRGFNMNLTFL